MAKIALTDLTTNYGSQTLHNNNNATIEDHLNNKVLYRNNPTGEPNTMENQLDMNSYRIINLAQGVLNTDAATVAQLNTIAGTTGTNVSQSRETQLGSAATARAFTLSGITYTLGANTLAVYRNGQRLERTEDYTETSTSVVTLTFDPNPNDRFVFVKNDISTSEVTTTGAISHTLGGTVHTLSDFLGNGIVYEFDTMAAAIASTKVYEGAVLLIKDRANSIWDVVLSSGVTENTYNIVQCTGVPTLSFVLRIIDNTFNPVAFGAPIDNSTDAYGAIAAMITKAADYYVLDGMSVIFDFGSYAYKLSAPIDFANIRRMILRGNFRFTSTHSGLYVAKFQDCRYLLIQNMPVFVGKGSTTFSTRTNMFGVLFYNTRTHGYGIVVENIIADAIRFTGTSSTNDLQFVQTRYCGSGISGATSASQSTTVSIVQNGSVNSGAQRAVITMSAVPQALKDYLDSTSTVDGSTLRPAYLNINGSLHWIESYSGSTVTVWPWIATSATGVTCDWIFGSGIFLNGGDVSVNTFGNIDAIVNGIGVFAGSLYPGNIRMLTTQNDGIGLVTGASTDAAVLGLNVNVIYCEANIYEYVHGTTYEDSPVVIGNNVALDVSLCQRLYSADAAGVRQQTNLGWLALTSDGGFTHTTLREYHSERVTISTQFQIHTPEDYFLRATNPVVTLNCDTGYLKGFYRRCKLVHWYRETNGMTPTGSITFTPPTGGTVNGKAINTSQVFNTASGPQCFVVTCSGTDGLTWYVEPLAASTVVKV